MNKVLTFATGAAFGCAVGALAALALAPHTGEEMRGLAAERAGGLAEDASDLGAGVASYARDMVRGVKGKGSEVLNNVRGNSGAAESDELREKIEAARERIAKQVAEAEAASEAAAATV